MNRGQVQYFRGIEIAYSGNCALIEKRHFDRAAAGFESLLQFVGRYAKRVGTEIAVAIQIGELALINEPHQPQPAAVPEQKLAGCAVERDPQSEVFDRGRIGDKDQPCHPRFKHNRVGRVETQNDALADAIDGRDTPAEGATAEGVEAGSNEDWFAGAAGALDAGDPAAGNVRDTAAHGFDFGQLGHGRKCGVRNAEFGMS
jgi:hypothetical protein